MEIKIESSKDQLKDLYSFLFTREIEVDEQYQELDGFHLEAGLQALIITLTPITIAAIGWYFKLEIAKVKAKNELEKNAQKILFEQWKFSASQELGWKKMELKEIELMEKKQLRESKKVQTKK